MNIYIKYFLGLLALVLVVLFCWYFSSVISYILISAAISFVGKPIIDVLDKLKFGSHKLGNSLKAGIAVVVVWLLFILFFGTVIPLVTSEFQSLGKVSVSNIMDSLREPLNRMGDFFVKYGMLEKGTDMTIYINDTLNSLLGFTKISSIFGSLAGTLSNVFIGVFSVTFISFFFLKDSSLFGNMVRAIVPSRYEEQTQNALDSIEKLLVRYFVGIVFEVICVLALNTIGLSIVGLTFSNAIVIGLALGILNVVPYIGPLIGMIFGLMVGVALNLNLDFNTQLLPLLIYMEIVFALTQLIDNFVLQPLIYGKSVYAHPLEIFIVILMAGSMAGIPGMILAIPAYTVLRVILREFFNNYKLVKSITKGLDSSNK